MVIFEEITIFYFTKSKIYNLYLRATPFSPLYYIYKNNYKQRKKGFFYLYYSYCCTSYSWF